MPAPDDHESRPESWSDVDLGGPVLTEFISAPELLDTLYRLTGERWAPLNRASYGYSYYRTAGQNKGLHRDNADCELTLVTCVDDQPGEGGDLLLYPLRVCEPLSAIRATPDDGCVRLRLQPGETLLMFGHEIPHRVTPIGAGRTRITATIGYRRANAESRRTLVRGGYTA
jgi:hypothetical protein